MPEYGHVTLGLQLTLGLVDGSGLLGGNVAEAFVYQAGYFGAVDGFVF